MKIRAVLLAVVMIAAFVYITSNRHLPFDLSLYRRVLPSVVIITSHAVAYDFFYGAVPQEGMGSGFIIDKEGHILTNFHVIANARQLEVTTSNRKKFKAEVIGADPSHDLAVI